MKASESARADADTICNPIDDPHMHSILCKKFTQAEARGREAGLREAAAVVDGHNLAGFRLGEAQTFIVNSITALIPGEPT